MLSVSVTSLISESSSGISEKSSDMRDTLPVRMVGDENVPRVVAIGTAQ